MGMSTAVLDNADASPRRAQRFPPDKFVTVPGVAVFAEHSTHLRDGTPVTYDRDALEQIAACCNRRIDETGNYAAVCIGHTDGDDGDKPLIGFAGPFRVEDRDGRAVIVADFHIFKEDKEKLQRYPRPSPEVWIPKDGFDPTRIFLDPIAMLGAEVPRLDLGMTFLYRARDGDMLCEKYAATFPGPSSVAMPRFKRKRKEKYLKHEDTSMSQLTPEDIQAILKAIESTDWYKWVRQQMAASAKEEAREEPVPGNERPPEADVPAKKEPYANEDPNGRDKAAQKPEDEEPPPERDVRDDTERPKRVEEYRCTTHYAKREALLQAQREIYQLRQALEGERARRVNSERRRRLESLARRYAVDVKEEMAMCAYGRMSDEAFEKHVARIEKYYRPLPVDSVLPTWAEADAGYPDTSREMYRRKQEEELSAKALEYARQAANRGQWVSYDEALALAKSGKI
jgi:hypothetical protein